jgi:FAD:protein FMN transferase
MNLVKTLDQLVPGSCKYAHHAMATIFEIVIFDKDEKYASQAADEAFRRLDILEQTLSRFIANSDISRINRAQQNEFIRVGVDTMECLNYCEHFNSMTHGAFDISIGFLLHCWMKPDHSFRKPNQDELKWARQHTGMQHIRIDQEKMTVQVLIPPVFLDLGAIGKGYAVDQMAHILLEWDVDHFLIHGGTSSVRAHGYYGSEPGWPVSLSRPWQTREIFTKMVLHDQSMGASGLLKGRHIINPRTAQPVIEEVAAWATGPAASLTDALSTAFMVMTQDEIAKVCASNPEIDALLFYKNGNRMVQYDHRGKIKEISV